jgi:transposase
MAHMTLMTGPARRRRWSEEQRADLLTAAFGPGGNVAEVARRADVCTSLLYRWRRARMVASADLAFIPAVVETAAETGDGPGPAPSIAAIVVELAAGARVTINATASASLVSATLRALR